MRRMPRLPFPKTSAPVVRRGRLFFLSQISYAGKKSCLLLRFCPTGKHGTKNEGIVRGNVNKKRSIACGKMNIKGRWHRSARCEKNRGIACGNVNTKKRPRVIDLGALFGYFFLLNLPIVSFTVSTKAKVSSYRERMSLNSESCRLLMTQTIMSFSMPE